MKRELEYLSGLDEDAAPAEYDQEQALCWLSGITFALTQIDDERRASEGLPPFIGEQA